MADHKRIGLTLQLQNRVPETASIINTAVNGESPFPLVLRVPEWCQLLPPLLAGIYKGIAGKNLVRTWNVNEQVKLILRCRCFEWAGGKSYRDR
jgi:hypothetical protein